MKKISFLFLLIILAACGKQKINNIQLDFSGIDQFWKINSILESDKIPGQNDWDKLFHTPGYEALVESEFSKEYFINNYSLAYMPSMQNQIPGELENKSGLRKAYFKHILKVKTEKEAIQNQREYLISSNIFTEATELTKKYLPKTSLSEQINIPVSFVIFGNDARGYTPIVIDLLFSIGEEESLKRLIAHEAHHFFRNQKIQIAFPDEDSTDYNIIWMLNQLQSEGIADLIDKEPLFFSGGIKEDTKWAKIYRDYFDNSNAVIKELDNLLQSYYLDNSSRTEISDIIRSIVPMSGHPTGFYMSKIIIEELGINVLIENIHNPFKFFTTFNEAVEKTGNQVVNFSRESIALINDLEMSYNID